MVNIPNTIVSFEADHVIPITLAFIVFAWSVTGSNIIAGLLRHMDNIELFVVGSKILLQGVVVSLIGNTVYTTSDYHFGFITGNFQTKEMALLITTGVSAGMGIIVGGLIPWMVERVFTFQVIQTMGLFWILGMILVHQLVPNWRLDNELLHLMSALVISGLPLLA